MKPTSLILLTNGFPYEQGEQFLETEILHLSKSFEKVFIYTTSTKGEKRDLPNNVEVKEFKCGSTFSVKKLVFRRSGLIMKLFLKEFWSPKRKKHYKGNYKFHFNNLLGIINDAEKFQNELGKHELTNAKIYSYWFGPWGDIMCMVNVISNKKYPFISRVHGYDYDVDQRKEGFIPFRDFQMKYIHQISAVSEYGYNRIGKEYPAFKNISVSRLGVTDNGDNPMNENELFHIVSCSSFIPLKGVHLIIEILKRLTFTVKWTHFGDGPLRDRIYSLAQELPENIDVNFKGFVANDVIIEFYKKEPIDLFMNVSELEGIPVSIMEAISFGIPSTGCKICGVPEIVTAQSGFLFEKEFEINDAVAQIVIYQKLTKSDKFKFREEVKTFWKKKFDADVNYPTFISENLQ